jgi:ABC-type proline/glycine betaine transport system substrate-binding protein
MQQAAYAVLDHLHAQAQQDEGSEAQENHQAGLAQRPQQLDRVAERQMRRARMARVASLAPSKLPNGADYGFQANNQRILANRAFAMANPAAAKLCLVMKISANDISAQNLRMRDGEKSGEDITRHVQAWIKGHQKTYDGWLDDARKAAVK